MVIATPRARRFTLRHFTLALLFLIALVPRLLTFQFSLPFVAYVDEPAAYLKAQEWRGLPRQLQGYHDGYPPAFLSMQVLAQVALESNGQEGLVVTTHFFRFISSLFDALTAVILALTMTQLSKILRLSSAPLLGLLAGAIWAFSPLLIEHGVLAIPDPMVYCLSASALWFAIRAGRDPRWIAAATWSVLCGVAAVWLKYNALPLIGMGGLVTLWYWLRRETRRQATVQLIIQASLCAFTAFFLLVVYRAADINTPGTSDVLRTSGLTNLFTPQRIYDNVVTMIAPTDYWLWVALVSLGVGILVSVARRQFVKQFQAIGSAGWLAIIVCLWPIVFIPWESAALTAGSLEYVRFVIPATVALVILIACMLGYSIGAITEWLGALARRRVQLSLIALIGLAIMLLPMGQIRAYVTDRRLPDSRLAMRRWYDINLPPERVLVTNGFSIRIFNPYWGGILTRHWVDWWFDSKFAGRPIESWRKDYNISYVTINEFALNTMRNSEAGQAWLKDTLQLREFGGEGWRGPKVTLFRLWRPQQDLTVDFGSVIRLSGIDGTLGAGQAYQAGSTVPLTLYWTCLAKPPVNYSMFIHLVPDDGTSAPVAQFDGSPASSDYLPSQWTVGETLFNDKIALSLPANLPAGTYKLRVGLYDYGTGIRLTTNAGADAYDLGQITVR